MHPRCKEAKELSQRGRKLWVLSGEETKARKGKVSSSPYQLSGNSGVKPGALGPMSLGSPLNSGVGLHPPDARLALLLNAPRR
ncbi:gamma-glutamyltransferase 1, isoform CRA_c [Rattus norvegicus]|uniref:Gamma-glutamyltransferase 1, isoform CRA_c n=1 Tax=Rattus norvegicus TaxID=10116 RepID=A6JKJ6_RAT|nr:gamma-glutamyltransferase 1, isoform CRA_c [Rattus norvegicus]